MNSYRLTTWLSGAFDPSDCMLASVMVAAFATIAIVLVLTWSMARFANGDE